MPGQFLKISALLLGTGLWLTSDVGSAGESAGVSPLARLVSPDGSESLVAITAPAPAASASPPAFLAVVRREWPAGLVPLFPVEKDGRFELRRLPPKGRENFTDPLFFALPRADETNAALLAGRWAIHSTNSSNHKHWLAMDLAVDGERVAGRLDQDTDYRFAYVTEGTWRTHRLTLAIEYLNDRYELTADLHDGRLAGSWRRTDDTERGVWVATRPQPQPIVPPGETTRPLYEWRGPDRKRRYDFGDEPLGAGWERTEPPLGRVWPAE